MSCSRLPMNVWRCLPLALFPSIMPIKQFFSMPPARRSCPRLANCLDLMIFMMDLLVPALLNSSSFVILSVHQILIILLMNHISAASILFFISPLIVQVSQPYISVDHTKHFRNLNLESHAMCVFVNIFLCFSNAVFAIPIRVFISLFDFRLL